VTHTVAEIEIDRQTDALVGEWLTLREVAARVAGRAADREKHPLTGVLEGGKRVAKRYLTDRLAERRFRGLFGCERSLVRELEAFVSTPWGQPRLEATGWDGCRVTEMIDAVYRSSRQDGVELVLEPRLVPLASRSRRRVFREQWL